MSCHLVLMVFCLFQSLTQMYTTVCHNNAELNSSVYHCTILHAVIIYYLCLLQMFQPLLASTSTEDSPQVKLNQPRIKRDVTWIRLYVATTTVWTVSCSIQVMYLLCYFEFKWTSIILILLHVDISLAVVIRACMCVWLCVHVCVRACVCMFMCVLCALKSQHSSIAPSFLIFNLIHKKLL